MNAPHHGFKAGLFHPDEVGNEVVEGRVYVGRWAVHFDSPQITEEIPIDQVELDLETNSDRVYFNDAGRPDIKIFTFDRSILKHPTFIQCNPLRNQVGAIAQRRETSRHWKLTAYFVGICFLLYWFGNLAMGLAVRAVVNRVPQEWEQRFGKAQIDELRQSGMLVNDSNRVAQLATLAEPLMRVVPGMKSEPKFFIVESDEPNAFALPGGYIIVHTALLDLLDRPEELLGVLAHEIAHVTQKHIQRKLVSAMGPLLIFGVFLHSDSGAGNLLGVGSAILVIQGFSQEYETEADEVGWKYLVKANIDPRGMIGTFRKFKEYEMAEMEKYRLNEMIPQAFQSHPALDKRISRLESRWKKIRNPAPFIELDSSAWHKLKEPKSEH